MEIAYIFDEPNCKQNMQLARTQKPALPTQCLCRVIVPEMANPVVAFYTREPALECEIGNLIDCALLAFIQTVEIRSLETKHTGKYDRREAFPRCVVTRYRSV